MPPRSKAKIQNQAKKEDLTPIAQQIKSVMTPSIPIEQVVYLNDNKVVYHENGSNRYWINYPDTWRTVSNQQLVLGVRAIRKFWNNLRMEMKVVFEVIDADGENEAEEEEEEIEKSWTFIFQANLSPSDVIAGREKEFVARINEQWKEWVEDISERAKSKYFADIASRRWLYCEEPLREFFIIRSPCPTNESEFTIPYTVSVTELSISRDFQTCFYTGMFFQRNSKSGGTCRGIEFKPRNNEFKYYNDTYLLAASFVGQTNYQYLGFTNTQFNPPKQYVIPNGDTKFWIDVVSADGLDEVELNSRDLIAIELQLITIPLQKYA